MSDQQVIAAFAAARKSQAPLSHLPETGAPELDRAFRLQCGVTRELGWEQAGWKIGCTSDRAMKALNAQGPFPGTIFTNRVYRSGEMFPTIPENKRVVEPEVCFTMAKGLPPRGRDYTVDEVMAAAAHVCVAIEVVNPRTPRGFGDAVPWFIVDGGLNEGIVLGEARKLLGRADYASLRGRVWRNGHELQGGIGANALGGGDLALTWLANHLNAHGLGLDEGEIITTGVITEFFSASQGDDIEVRFEHLGAVTTKF